MAGKFEIMTWTQSPGLDICEFPNIATRRSDNNLAPIFARLLLAAAATCVKSSASKPEYQDFS
jgi:hypothetical protein